MYFPSLLFPQKVFIPYTSKKVKGFTLIELLIVIGILAILATVVVIVINPNEMIKQSRDATRLSDVVTIVKAITVFESSGVEESALGNTNTIYISVPATNTNCSDLNLPTPLSGWSYNCSSSANYRKSDGTGWIPIDFDSVAYGSPLTSLPIDPTNATSTGLYYTYIRGSIAVSAGMESVKYLAGSAINDSGYSPYRYEAGTDLSENAYIPNCGGVPVSYGGKLYDTVQIGRQCWFADNLEYDDGCSAITWVNDTDVGWCGYYGGGADLYGEGFLYQWSAAMDGSTTDGARGLCPVGWHVATDKEYKTLIEGQATVGCETTLGWQCSPAASHLSDYTSGHDNSSGFSGLLSGYRHYTNGSFGSHATDGYLWSSTGSGGEAISRHLSSGSASEYRDSHYRKFAFAVRCLKD